MSTKLQYEATINNQFPQLFALQIHSPKAFTVTVYACDSSWQLPDALKYSMESFLKEKGAAHYLHQVRPFFDLCAEEIPSNITLPTFVKDLAMQSDMSYANIKQAIENEFKCLDPNSFKVEGNTITVKIRPEISLNKLQLFVVKRYLSEIVPFTTTINITQ